MIILSAKDLTKAYGEDVILKDVSFNINKGDRVGIIGINGAGKTTLLDILARRKKAESGDFFVSEDTTIGYLKQKDDFSAEGTVIEQVEKIFSHFPAMEKEMEMLAKEIAGLAGSPDQEPLLTRYDRIQHEFMDRGGYLYKSEIKGILSSMAFGPEMYQKTVSTLSGGEKTRLAL
ncbi:MAG TPA: ATP-binding cassette domain-containing protein, partial [Bacillota bacterium]|nr:ATP-binding cassette domain-containing protein [Bacillota bacterium]